MTRDIGIIKLRVTSCRYSGKPLVPRGLNNLIATGMPPRFPLYTGPYPPCPMRFFELNLLVAFLICDIVNWSTCSGLEKFSFNEAEIFLCNNLSSPWLPEPSSCWRFSLFSSLSISSYQRQYGVLNLHPYLYIEASKKWHNYHKTSWVISQILYIVNYYNKLQFYEVVSPSYIFILSYSMINYYILSKKLCHNSHYYKNDFRR